MAEAKIKIQHKFLSQISDPNGIDMLLHNVMDALSDSLREFVKDEISRNSETAAMVNQSPDPEALRAILRSIKVQVKSTRPMSLKVMFDDEYGHWYQQAELPPEFKDSIKQLFDKAIENWFRSGKPNAEFSRVLGL